MTKWKAFERSCKYGVALYNFQRDGQEYLKLNVGDSERHQDFETVRDMMQELIDWRRKIMSRKLTAEELRDLQQKISGRIDIGNAMLGLVYVRFSGMYVRFSGMCVSMLGLDLVVRDDQGNILDPFTTSTIELYRQIRNSARFSTSSEILGAKRD
ncbi:hypothetical protein KUTeg_004813 [Tegillarca granosa]|uniref:Dedicator of cytokinesis N-terminal domain-containing protein n=1 Tax=Tegillarca granosa TaxID=220873 RepID=A0ABQ9FHZ8_TEGGR|nr:hypothetical protein KUTeg_004813 [Tegillarca granosa]